MLRVPIYLAPSAIEGLGPFAAGPVPAALHRRVVAAATVLLLTSGSLAAQELWTEMSTLGYGGAATGLGIAACWSCGYESAAVVILGAAIGGMVAGYHVGGGAEGAVRRGERPRSLQLLGARVGT